MADENGVVGVKLTGDWQAAQKLLKGSPTAVKRALGKALAKKAHAIADDMKQRINHMKPENAKSTIYLKGSDKPLINHGDYKNAIGAVKKGDLEWYVGVPAANAKAVRLADIHERGRTIIMLITPRQARFLHWLRSKIGDQLGAGKGGGETKGFLIIHIPARPVIGPSIEKAMNEGEDYMNMVAETLDTEFQP